MDLNNMTPTAPNVTSTHSDVSVTSEGSALTSLLGTVTSMHSDVSVTLAGSTLFMESDIPKDSELSTTSEGPALIFVLGAGLLFVTFAIGILGNSFYLWILGCKMKQTVSTVWFYHLIWAYLLFTLIIPFYATYLLMDLHWLFGVVMCKLVTFVVSLSMFVSVFLLMVISVDRCVSGVYPLWTRTYRTTRRASAVCVSVWVLALVLSAPYLAFPKTAVYTNNKISCFNDYAFSDDWATAQIQQLRRTVHWSMFILQLVMGLLLPFSVMTACYVKLAVQLKTGNLSKTNKPFKVIGTAVVSFFVCWLPFHVYRGLLIYQESVAELLLFVVNALTVILCCINASCTPILYLFIGKTFRDLFKMLIRSLFGRAFSEDPIPNLLDSEDNLSGSPTSCQSPVMGFYHLESPV